MKWVGITGGLGSGKSTVSEMIRNSGFVVIDADQLARQALGPESSILPVLKTKFGAEVFNPDDTLNRKALGEKVFKSKEDLLWLESLVHPLVQSQVKILKALALKKGHQAAFYDVPLLFEKKMEEQFDQVIVVSAPLELLIKRVKARDGLSEGEIQSRLDNQLPLSEKEQRADHVILNSSSLDKLQKQVAKVVEKIIA